MIIFFYRACLQLISNDNINANLKMNIVRYIVSMLWSYFDLQEDFQSAKMTLF